MSSKELFAFYCRANENITIIDNYIDSSVFKMLTKKNKNVEAVMYTRRRGFCIVGDELKFFWVNHTYYGCFVVEKLFILESRKSRKRIQKISQNTCRKSS